MKPLLPLACTGLLAAPLTFAQTPPERPNIIFILADDLGPDGVGIYRAFDYEEVTPALASYTQTGLPNRTVRPSLTPRLDQLARNGLRFTRCHATAICSPSRAQFITGQYPWRCGVIDIDGSNYRSDPFKPDHSAMLREAGYWTGACGKSANEAGFDEALFMGVGQYWPNGIGNAPYGGDTLQNFVLDFIERNAPSPSNNYRPFYFYYSLLHPHTPIQPTPDSLEFNGGAPPGETAAQTTFRLYVDNIRYIDKVVGQIEDKLTQLGIRDNTLIMFSGDNGSLGSANGARLQGYIWDSRTGRYRLLNGAKGDRLQNREGTSLVPLIVQWPQVIHGARAGGVITDLVDFTDFLPTFADIGGGTINPNWELHGQSMAPILRGQPYTPRRWVYTQIQSAWCVRGPDYRLNRDGTFFDMSDAPFAMTAITRPLTPAEQALKDEYQAVLDAFDPANGPTYEAHVDNRRSNTNHAQYSPISRAIRDWKWANFNSWERWETQYSGDLADPDGDGVPNIFERAFGWNPRSGTDRLPEITFNGLRGSVSLPSLGDSTTAVSVLSSEDLSIWQNVTPQGSGPYQFQAEPSQPNGNRLFMRLRAARTEPLEP